MYINGEMETHVSIKLKNTRSSHDISSLIICVNNVIVYQSGTRLGCHFTKVGFSLLYVYCILKSREKIVSVKISHSKVRCALPLQSGEVCMFESIGR